MSLNSRSIDPRVLETPRGFACHYYGYGPDGKGYCVRTIRPENDYHVLTVKDLNTTGEVKRLGYYLGFSALETFFREVPRAEAKRVEFVICPIYGFGE